MKPYLDKKNLTRYKAVYYIKDAMDGVDGVFWGQERPLFTHKNNDVQCPKLKLEELDLIESKILEHIQDLREVFQNKKNGKKK